MENVKTWVLNLLQPNQPITKKEMAERLGVTERAVRRAISELVQEGETIIALSQTKGYTRITKDNDDYYDLLQHQVNDYYSRINILSKRIDSLQQKLKEREK